MEKFPKYRKYNNGKSFFKILSASQLMELQIIGSSFQVYELIAQIYPDKLFIQDLLSLEATGIENSSEEEFNLKLNSARENLKEITLTMPHQS
jgi:hypothetical protein